MILQELCNYYDRLTKDPEADVAPPGTIVQGVAFEVVIRQSGDLEDIHDLREMDGNTKRNKKMILPGKAKPSGSGMNPSLFGWDNTKYMLGYLDPDSIKPDEKKRKLERCSKAHVAYKEAMQKRKESVAHPDYSAFCSFLDWWKPEMASEYPVLKEVSGLFGVVRLSGSPPRYLHDLPNLGQMSKASEPDGTCLVTGQPAHIARLHDIKIKGVWGAQTSGASLVSFNQDAFTSYGRNQSHNAPVGEEAAFKYSTALNKLLDRNSARRVQIGDASCVFWADAPSPGEDIFRFGLSGDLAEDSDTARSIEASLMGLKEGLAQVPDAETGFHVLGLSPNASRLSVRFWYSGTVGEILDRVVRHQQELNIVRSPKDRDLIPAWLILLQTARESKEIPPLLGGALLQAILTGGRYPDALYAAILRRIKADRRISHPRAAAIKAILTRNHAMEGIEMLNVERPEPAYQLGRLFAALEKAQEDALPGINATIKDRYFGAASATPGTVFPRLIRLSQHHIGKLEGGRKVVAEKRVEEICGRIDRFPSHLDLVGQGLFALGYYHQRQDLFTKKADRVEKSPSK